MEPFRIICETCRSRLKIRSPEVIGEIHACPKCGGMVHVVPPAGWRPDVASIAAAQPGLPNEAALSLSATASAIIPASVVGELHESLATEMPVAEAAAICPSVQAGTPWLLWAAGGSAVLIAGVLSVAIWPGHGDKANNPSSKPAAIIESPVTEQPKPVPITPQADHPRTAISDPYAIDHSNDIATSAAEPANRQPAARPTAASSVSNPIVASPPAPLSQPPAEAKTENANTNSPRKAAAVAEPTPPSAAAQLSKSVEPVTMDREHPPVLKFDPLDFDPDRLSVNAKSSTDSTASTSSIPDRGPGEVISDHNRGRVAAAVGSATPEGKVQSAGDPVPPVATNQSIIVRRGQPTADAAPSHSAGQPLATRLKAFQVSEIPILRMIETLSEIAGSGITLDPIALELAGASPQTVMSVDAQDATLEKILRDALTKQRLDFITQGNQIRVVLPKPDERRAVDYDVKDLVTGTDGAEVAKLIEKFVAPATWSGSGAGTMQVNGTTLNIEQSDTVRRQVVIFCERLRLARGLALRSKYPAALLSVESPYQRLAAKLNEHTIFTFPAWTRLTDVVRQWREMSGLTIVVDWASLAEAELNPSSPVACSVNDRTWQDAFSGILAPLGLGWWAFDGQTIQIASLDAIGKIQRIEFYSVPEKLRGQFASGQALIDSLQKEVVEAAGKHSKPRDVAMAFDEPSGRLIVLGSPEVHRDLSQRFAQAGQLAKSE